MSNPVQPYALAALCAQYLRPWTSATVVNGEVTAAVFSPPLTAPEQATFTDLLFMAKFSVDMTLAEWQSIKPDAAGLKAYLGLANPTLAQTASATKAIIRVLATIVRD